MIVVRESNGVLRKATEQEHEKMLQVYFPQEGKPNYMPSMFKPENLEVISFIYCYYLKRLIY
jgi:small subunit ribosomal protein S22